MEYRPLGQTPVTLIARARTLVQPYATHLRRALAVSVAVVALALAWQIGSEALVQRLSTASALEIDPMSASLATKTAEGEFAAGHPGLALGWARKALTVQPFNVVALRVAGEVISSTDPVRANQAMTLAGNWSLRDGPAHVWLFEQRLRHLDYASAFAHADTLLRRIDEARPALLQLLASVAEADPRSLPPLASRLAADPPWRREFFADLAKRPTDIHTAEALMIALHATNHPANNQELASILNALVSAGRYQEADALWRHVSVGASARSQPYDGNFSNPGGPEPFAWMIAAGGGATMTLTHTDDETPPRTALRVQYDGYSPLGSAKTFMLLAPGVHTLGGYMRNDSALGADKLGWTVSCADDSRVIAEVKGPPVSNTGTWQQFATRFSVPGSGCSGQWLQLTAYPGERRTDIGLWYSRY